MKICTLKRMAAAPFSLSGMLFLLLSGSGLFS
jgi:hypothetical protein